MTIRDKVPCGKCQGALTPGELLLSTVFVEEEPLCYTCSCKARRLGCSTCNQSADVVVNGNSYCHKCAGETFGTYD
jgi:hypothetical protein